MIKEVDYSKYPNIEKYSREYNMSLPVLAEGYELEAHYHKELLLEKDSLKREKIYSEFYSKLMAVYGRENAGNTDSRHKDAYVRLFERELKGKSVIDFGCGQAHMLQSISRILGNSILKGVDVYLPKGLMEDPKIQFEESSVINYESGDKYQVAISDNVIEHLVKEDAKMHLKSIYNTLHKEGRLIIMMPNRLFGPADVTRIKDFSHSGKTQARGGHVNESTYTEMIEELKEVGFTRFYTVLPVPRLKFTILRKLRTGTGWVRYIERNNWLLGIFRSLKIGGVCPIRFSITLIAVK